MMIYFNTWEAFIEIDDLKTTPKLLLIWIVGHSQARIPFEFTNKQIAKKFVICEGTAKAAVKELAAKKYIDIDFPGSPLRKLKWSDKAKAIYKTEKRRAEEAKERRESTSTKNIPVDESTGIKNVPVTGIKNHPRPVQKTYHSIVNSNNNVTFDDEASDVDDKLFSSKASVNSKDNGAAFEKYWAAVPNKIAKQAAEKAWRKLAPDDELVAKIMAALEKQKLWREQANGKFRPEWPHPATWINGSRWNDEIEKSENCQPKASAEEVRRALGFD